MKINYVLIDYENVQVKSLARLRGEQFRVSVFLGPNNTRLPVELVLAIQDLGDRADYIQLETPGPNALDFHIAYHLGVLSTADPSGVFHIISKDSGFDPLVKYLKAKKIMSSRSGSIEEMPCFCVAPIVSVESSGGAPQTIQKPAAKRAPVDELVKVAVNDLVRRKASRPGSTQALLNTVHATCGKQIPLAEIKILIDVLVSRGFVKINGSKVTYVLPSE